MCKKLFFLLMLCVLLTACLPAPVPPTAVTTVTPAPYVPLARGTPLPPLYQSIQPGTVSSLTLLARWSGAAHSAGHLAFMPQGDKLVIDLQLWNVRDGMRAGEVQAPSREVNNNNPLVASSPDGRFIATTSEGWSLDIRATTLPERVLVFYLDEVVGSTFLFYMYFGSMGVVSAPDVSRQPIKNVSIDYAWSGMGEPSHLEYTVTIDRADLPEKMRVSVTTQPRDASAAVNKNIDPALVQAIGPAMVDLVPIRSFFALRPCTDNLPDWKADIIFSDGRGLKLITNSSNMFTLGGPWQVQIDGQKYVQFSPDLLSAFSDLFDALGLPLGLPMGTVCDRVDPFELAYP